MMQQFVISFSRQPLQTLVRMALVEYRVRALKQLLPFLCQLFTSKNKLDQKQVCKLTVSVSSGPAADSNQKIEPFLLSLKLPFQSVRVSAINSSFKSIFQYLSSLQNLHYSRVDIHLTDKIPSSYCIDMFFIAVIAYGVICSRWCISQTNSRSNHIPSGLQTKTKSLSLL